MANEVKPFEVETRKAKGAPIVKTSMTVNWAGVNQEDILALARRTLVIDWQRVQRDAAEPIPTKAHINASEWLKGNGRPTRAVTPERLLASVETMDEATLKRLEAALAQKKKEGKK